MGVQNLRQNTELWTMFWWPFCLNYNQQSENSDTEFLLMDPIVYMREKIGKF